MAILYATSGGRETRDIALDFLDQHLDALLPRMREDETTFFFGSLGLFYSRQGAAGHEGDPERHLRKPDRPRCGRVHGR